MMMYELPRWLKLLATGFVQSVSAGFGIIITGTAQNPVVSVDPAVIATTSQSETAGAAIAVGRAVYRVSPSGKMMPEAGTEQSVRWSFRGFAKTAAAADGNPITVSPNCTRATGLSGLTIGSGYYVSSGVLYEQGAALDAFVAGAASGTWYRFVGTAASATTLDQAWGEPQQVP